MIFYMLQSKKIQFHVHFKRTVWDFRNAHFNLFRAELSKINWEFIDVNDDINIITDMFTNKFMDIAKSTIPDKECIIRGKPNHGCTMK